MHCMESRRGEGIIGRGQGNVLQGEEEMGKVL